MFELGWLCLPNAFCVMKSFDNFYSKSVLLLLLCLVAYQLKKKGFFFPCDTRRVLPGTHQVWMGKNTGERFKKWNKMAASSDVMLFKTPASFFLLTLCKASSKYTRKDRVGF
jgi:hypothetical protein